MASILSITAPARQFPLLRSDFVSRSDKLFPKSVAAIGGKRGARVEAMGGGAKYKGTQMKEKQLTEMIEEKVKEAKEVCGDDMSSDECKVAWDEVEEVSQAKADLKVKLEVRDPLEYFCLDNPETDECRVYDD